MDEYVVECHVIMVCLSHKSQELVMQELGGSFINIDPFSQENSYVLDQLHNHLTTVLCMITLNLCTLSNAPSSSGHVSCSTAALCGDDTAMLAALCGDYTAANKRCGRLVYLLL